MIQIEDTIISLSLIKENFVCNLKECKGYCCIIGDSGAPLEKNEIEILKEQLPVIKSFLRKKGVEAIQEQGIFVIDKDGDYVTPLIDNRECAFTIFENEIAQCGIEKAFLENKITFRKPISCYLYPIRIKKCKNFDAVNYDRWEICKSAIHNGNKENVPLYIFVESALKEKYGNEWYLKLKIAAEEISSQQNNVR